MKTFKFKTTIKCSGCVANVTPILNSETTIQNWSVDITDPEKILTITTAGDQPVKSIELLEKAGYKIEPIH